MDPTFGHPLWIFSGVALVLIGFWLFGGRRAATPRVDCRRHRARETQKTLQARPTQCAVNCGDECTAE